jgi:hypothetical protein
MNTGDDGRGLLADAEPDDEERRQGDLRDQLEHDDVRIERLAHPDGKGERNRKCDPERAGDGEA